MDFSLNSSMPFEFDGEEECQDRLLPFEFKKFSTRLD
jgi:hypothetical protein